MITSLFSSSHVVPEGASVVLRRRTGRLVKVGDVGVGEEVDAGSSARVAHDRSVPNGTRKRRLCPQVPK